ncbi:YcnI family copper-binding membrane protein [Paenibacillus koleovorans]|uniref:YcnI family copper-binding membrane protein n=1 Tax=Paenibacillus koleovorans TaxID=121608 RepID=UPI000FDB5655|nr:YcnI family protein [Paenibacillus koleovorans]
MKKLLALLSVSLMAMMLFAGLASAHVTVLPSTTTQGVYEKFTVRVPSETANTNTVKVEVKFPEGVTISRVEPKPDWKYELSKDGTGKITGVVFTATGAGLAVTEFTEFNLSGKVAADAKTLSWKAYQTYKDGSVAEWVGAEGSAKPASVTTVKPGTGDSGGHDTGGSHSASADGEGGSNGNLPLILSIVAVVLGAASLLVSLLRKTK